MWQRSTAYQCWHTQAYGLAALLKVTYSNQISQHINVMVGKLVVLGLTALSDSISVYIGPSPKEREKEKRKERGE